MILQIQYEEDLQAYLKITGLQASDLVKTKKKKDTKKSAASRAAAAATAAAQAAAAAAAAANNAAQPPAQQFITAVNPAAVSVNGPVTIPFQGTAAVSGATLAPVGALPHFSQVWTGQQQYTMATVAQSFTNGEGGGGDVQHVTLADGTVTSSAGTVIYG